MGRVTQANHNFNKEIELAPRVSPEFELTLDSTPAQHSIQTMNFFQMKGQWNTIYPIFSSSSFFYVKAKDG